MIKRNVVAQGEKSFEKRADDDAFDTATERLFDKAAKRSPVVADEKPKGKDQ